jgi:hypothetical protein
MLDNNLYLRPFSLLNAYHNGSTPLLPTESWRHPTTMIAIVRVADKQHHLEERPVDAASVENW